MMVLDPVKFLAKSVFRVMGLEVRRKPNVSASSLPQIPDAPLVPEHLLAECRVLPSREDLLEVLPAGGVVAEIGVADGAYSDRILKFNKPRRLILIDVWDTDRYRNGLQAVREKFSDGINAGTVQVEQGLSVDALKRLPPRLLDWAYLDTAHDYKTTKAELRLLRTRIKPGGYIAGHDFCVGNPHAKLPYGVIPAVCEFCVEEGLGFAYITLASDGHFSFCLWTPGDKLIDGVDDSD